MSCDSQLQAVETCAKADPASCDCFDQDNFQESFKKDTANAFKSTLAFKPPNDPEFCVEANFRTCKPFTAPSGDLSCCCNKESEEYINCELENVWLTKYAVKDSDCKFDYSCFAINNGGLDENGCPPGGCGGDGGGGGGGALSTTMIIIIGGSVGGVLLLLLVLCLCLRSRSIRRRTIAAEEENKDKKQKGNKKDKKKKKKDVESGESSSSDDDSSSDESRDRDKKKRKNKRKKN